MTSETTAIDTSLDDLLNRHFAGRVVRKDLTKLVKEGANVPVYVLEYLLGTYCATNDEESHDDGSVAAGRFHDYAIKLDRYAEMVASQKFSAALKAAASDCRKLGEAARKRKIGPEDQR